MLGHLDVYTVTGFLPTVDVVKRGEAPANFERDLITHFQRISKAAALYAKALLGGVGGVRQGLAVTRGCDWVTPTAEETWRNHTGSLMVALKSTAKLLRAIPSSRLVIMAAYNCVAPAPITEKDSFMEYLQKLPDAGPTAGQAVLGVQNWKCSGRRLDQSVKSLALWFMDLLSRP